jgi:hypothetical protein
LGGYGEATETKPGVILVAAKILAVSTKNTVKNKHMVISEAVEFSAASTKITAKNKVIFSGLKLSPKIVLFSPVSTNH